jgi:hypothetical protein
MGPNFILDKGYLLVSPAADAGVADNDDYPAIFSCMQLINATSVAISDTSGQKVLGIIQEDVPVPSSAKANGMDYIALGRIVNIRILGISRVQCTGVINVGSRVISNGDGTVVAAASTTSNQESVGIMLGASAATGDQVDILLTPGAQTYGP